MRVTNQMMANQMTAQLFRQVTQMVKTQEQINSGKRINRPSDDPADMSSVLSYRTTISNIEQYSDTISKTKLNINTVDDLLAMVGDLLIDAKEIAYDTSPTMRSELAEDVASIRDQILQMANYQIDGQYIFSGESSDTAPYNSTTWNYNGDDGTRDALIGENMQIHLTADGTSIFGADSDNVFNILNDLETALTSPASPTDIEAQISRLDTANDRVTTVRAKNASVYQRLEATEKHYDYFKVNVQELLSNTEDADVAAAIINYKVQQTTYESTLATSSMIIKKSLIDFLQ